MNKQLRTNGLTHQIMDPEVTTQGNRYLVYPLVENQMNSLGRNHYTNILSINLPFPDGY